MYYIKCCLHKGRYWFSRGDLFQCMLPYCAVNIHIRAIKLGLRIFIHYKFSICVMLCYVKRISVYALSWVQYSTITFITWLQCDDVGDCLTPHGYAYLTHDENHLNDFISNGCRINDVCELNICGEELFTHYYAEMCICLWRPI